MTSKTTELTQATDEAAPVSMEGLASLAIDPSTMNGVALRMYSSKTMGVELDLKTLVLALNHQVEEMRSGGKSQIETMLLAQVMTLNAIFTEMARRAALNMGQHLDATEAYTRMALRAQNQARATLETLATLHNPSVVIAKQANITSGPQQVNNVLMNADSDLIQPNQLSGTPNELCQNS